MSRIDTARTLTPSSEGSSSRLNRAQLRNSLLNPSQIEASRPPVGPQAFVPQHEQTEHHDDAIAALGAVPAADMEPIASLGSERLVGELSRIELLLQDRLEANPDPALRQAIETGGPMLAETIRRLRLVQAGSDSLVLKR